MVDSSTSLREGSVWQVICEAGEVKGRKFFNLGFNAASCWRRSRTLFCRGLEVWSRFLSHLIEQGWQVWTGCAYHKVQPVSLPQVVIAQKCSLLQLFASQHQLLVTRADVQLGFHQLLQRGFLLMIPSISCKILPSGFRLSHREWRQRCTLLPGESSPSPSSPPEGREGCSSEMFTVEMQNIARLNIYLHSCISVWNQIEHQESQKIPKFELFQYVWSGWRRCQPSWNFWILLHYDEQLSISSQPELMNWVTVVCSSSCLGAAMTAVTRRKTTFYNILAFSACQI